MTRSGLHAAEGNEALNHLTQVLRGLVVARLSTDEALDAAVDHALHREPADCREPVFDLCGEVDTGQRIEPGHAPDGAAIDLLHEAHELVVASDVAAPCLLGVDSPTYGCRGAQRDQAGLDKRQAKIIVRDEANALVILGYPAFLAGKSLETHLVEAAAREHQRRPMSLRDLGGDGRDHRVDVLHDVDARTLLEA